MASPARDNRTRDVLELMRAGKAPYLAVGWFPFQQLSDPLSHAPCDLSLAYSHP